MVLSYKKPIAAIACFSFISSFVYPMDKTVVSWKNPVTRENPQENLEKRSASAQDQTVGTWKPAHRRTPPLAGPSVLNCNPCCNQATQDSPQRRNPEPTRIHVEEMTQQATHESHPSRELTSLSFATATDFKERESKELADTQGTKQLPVSTSVSVHLNEMDKLEKEDSCMQRSLAKVSGFNRKYKINYILGGLGLISAGISIYNLATGTDPEPEWEHVVNTTAGVACVQAALAQVTAEAINKLNQKGNSLNETASQEKQPVSHLKKVGNFCKNNIGYITLGFGTSVAIANIAQGNATPATLNAIDALVSLTEAGACGVSEVLETSKAKIKEQQQAERKRRHGTAHAVELDGRRITFSNVSTRTTESSQDSSANSTARSESRSGEMLV